VLWPLVIATAAAGLTFAALASGRLKADLLIPFPAQLSGFESPGRTAEPARPTISKAGPRWAVKLERARFFDDTVRPLIEELDAENRAAADRCLRRIERTLARYHRGVAPFVEEMTSLSTRFGILKRMPGGWWAGDQRVEQYVHEKFEQHLFSERQLERDLSRALMQFRQDVEVNQNVMLTQVHAALSLTDLPAVRPRGEQTLLSGLAEHLDGCAIESGSTSVEVMLGSLVLGEVGAFAARSIVAGLLTRFAPSVALSSAAGASATVGASATGAGGGSLGGPIGAAVGFGAGLAVGLVIDWWMTERFEEQLSEQLHAYLHELESTLLSATEASATEASATEASAGSVSASMPSAPAAARPVSTGLRTSLPRVCANLRAAYRDQFFQQLVCGDQS
jgi:hypothetical protein